MRAAKRCVQYLYDTRHEGLNYDRRKNHSPQGYADADFANQLSNRRSTSGRVIMMYGAAIMWSSRQQRTVALSTAEAEINSLLELGKDVIWLRRILAEFGTPVSGPTPLSNQVVFGISLLVQDAPPRHSVSQDPRVVRGQDHERRVLPHVCSARRRLHQGAPDGATPTHEGVHPELLPPE